MRITIPHSQNPKTIVEHIDRGIEAVFQSVGQGMVQFSEAQKNWVGNTMQFSFLANAGFVKAPIKGTVEVEETVVNLDVDLGLFGKFIPEETAKNAIESKVRGLLA